MNYADPFSQWTDVRAAKLYSPYVRDDLLYAIFVIALFVGVLLIVLGLDWLLTRRQARKRGQIPLARGR
jgi:hypothetical protein